MEVATRLEVFGPENVEGRQARPRADRVVLVWLGVSTFALGIGGHVVLLDAWIPRGLTYPRVGLEPSSLRDLRADLVLVGHGHFDHAADLGHAAATARAVVAPEPVLRRLPDGVRSEPAAGKLGEVRRHDVIDGVEVTSVGHVHSAPSPPRGLPRPVLPLPSPRALVRRPPRARDLVHLARHAADGGGPSALYLLRVGGFSLAWHDTSGPLADRAPEVLDVLAELGPVDVQSGALIGFNQLTHGLRDVRTYVEALRPRIFVPNHHDDWLPPLTAAGGAAYARPLADELAGVEGPAPGVAHLADPGDYMRPIVWHL